MAFVCHPVGAISAADEDRFRSRVMVTDSCHVWDGKPKGKDDDHAYFYANGRHLLAHRVAFALSKGDPGDRVVRHTCDNAWCVAPYHLVLGSQADNVDDAFKRGQLDTRGARSPMHRIGKGVFDEAKVKKVRAMFQEGMRQSEIARHFGVRDSHIADIRLGRKWAWVV